MGYSGEEGTGKGGGGEGFLLGVEAWLTTISSKFVVETFPMSTPWMHSFIHLENVSTGSPFESMLRICKETEMWGTWCRQGKIEEIRRRDTGRKHQVGRESRATVSMRSWRAQAHRLRERCKRRRKDREKRGGGGESERGREGEWERREYHVGFRHACSSPSSLVTIMSCCPLSVTS